ncbi:hypothetical protein [Dyella sp.]|uniref:hypothetical protein n=1 Tax=Dyella sp. TaxID=1869338 RepID=UPI002FDA465B
MFQPAMGFKARLKTKLSPDDRVLPLYPHDVARLASVLVAADDYTRLWIGDGVEHEVVKVTGLVQGSAIIDRAEEGTSPTTSPAGSCASFAWTPANLADFIQQGMGGLQPAVCSVSAASERVIVDNDRCAVSIDIPACAGARWRSGNQQFTQDDAGCVSAQAVDTPLVDGEYVNATVTVRDGHIVAIKSGTNIVYSGGGCCGCSGE